MHLLQQDHNGDFTLSEFYGEQIPNYAILSHTWIATDQEVTFKEIKKGRGKDKLGYNKLKFCAEQAAKDDLRYFWVDTCCIDKSSSAELQEAINSMFSWYRQSNKCYVYLSDVPSKRSLLGPLKRKLAQSSSVSQSRILSFERSRWFRRGWTLQELLAPGTVEFFDLNGKRIGDKVSLKTEISEVTGISSDVLLGDHSYLLKVSIDERLSWAAERQTTRDEDAAYSLLGLFDLHIPLLYGEGRTKAFRRLHRERDSALTYDRLSGSAANFTQGQTQAISTSLVKNVVDVKQIKRPASEELQDEETKKRPKAISPAQKFHPDLPELISPQMTSLPTSDADSVSCSTPLVNQDGEGGRERERNMQKWWNESISRHGNKLEGYSEVAVLLIRWDDSFGELGTQKEVTELESLLRSRFNYKTEVVKLNVRIKPQLQLKSRLARFTEEYGKPGNLLIVYYSGHAVWQDLRNQLQISASMNPILSKGLHRDAHANWTEATDILRSEDHDADVLTILDTSFASNASQRNQGAVQRDSRKLEVLAASSLDQTTQMPGQNSFTRALIDALGDLVQEYGNKPFTTFHLNQRICMDQRRRETPSQLWYEVLGDTNISLAPIVSETGERSGGRSQRPQTLRGRLTLSLDLRDDSLNREQIEYLARSLMKALENKPMIGLRKINWHGIKSARKDSFTRLALVMWAVGKFKRSIRRRHERTEPHGLIA